MIINIISTIIALLIYDGIKKLVKLFFIKKTKNKYEDLFDEAKKIFPYDIDIKFWGDE